MKAIFLALFIVAVSASPLPKDNDAVETSVNEVPDGAALEAGNLVGVKVKEHAEDAVVAIDLLGIAEAQAAAASATASSNSNEVTVVDIDHAMARFVHPMPEVMPHQPKPENPQPVPELEKLPVADAQINGKFFNDGPVQVQYNGPEDPGMLATLQDWFNVVVKYFNSAGGPAAPVAPSPALLSRH